MLLDSTGHHRVTLFLFPLLSPAAFFPLSNLGNQCRGGRAGGKGIPSAGERVAFKQVQTELIYGTGISGAFTTS